MIVTPSAPLLSPREAALRLARLPGLVWLDGGLEHGREGRFSFVGVRPTRVVSRAAGDAGVLACLRELGAEQELEQELEHDHDRDHGPLGAEEVPRWVGSLGYAALGGGDSQVGSGLYFARYDAFHVTDHRAQRSFLVGDDAAACERLAERLSAEPTVELGFEVGAVEVTEAEAHRRAIGRALEHIREGDIYQINLARRFRASFQGSALGLFLRMREASPVPLGLYLDAGEHALLGRSMERFLRFRRSDGSVYTSPIKGTLERTGDDRGEARSLRGDPKEHAEHAMIVDLMRNDLGRVARAGSVRIDELMAVLPFAELSHLVSTVGAVVDPGLGLDALLSATFPPGSVTGTPKRRAVEIIAELEPFSRGVYTGAYGFIDRAGGCSLAVAIRTALIQQPRDGVGCVSYFAGGGIVEASDPERETAETELKARVFLRSLEA